MTGLYALGRALFVAYAAGTLDTGDLTDDEQVALFRSWLAVAGPPARPLRGSATGGSHG